MKSSFAKRGVVWSICALAVMGLPFLTDNGFMLKVLAKDVGTNVLVVLGLALLFGYAGQVSLGHAAFVGIGAYSSAYAMMHFQWPWLAAVAFAALVSAAGGALLAMPSLRLRGHYLAMATLGFGEIAHIAFREAEPITGGFDGLRGIPPASIAGFEFTSSESIYWLVWGVVLLAILLAYNMVALRPGRSMRALHGSELGARACGVDTMRVKVEVFVISAALAGIAGSLYAHAARFISPEVFTLHKSIILLAMTVLGGTSSLVGPILAAVSLSMLPYADSFLPWLPDSISEFLQEWELDIYGLTIILVMLFAPGGIGGAMRRLRRRRAARSEKLQRSAA